MQEPSNELYNNSLQMRPGVYSSFFLSFLTWKVWCIWWWICGLVFGIVIDCQHLVFLTSEFGLKVWLLILKRFLWSSWICIMIFVPLRLNTVIWSFFYSLGTRGAHWTPWWTDYWWGNSSSAKCKGENHCKLFFH